MLRSIAAGNSAPVGPPASPSGNQPATRAMSSGIPDTSPMMTVACSPRHGSSRSPARNSTRSWRPSFTAFSRAVSIAASDRSHPITRLAPSRAATNESTPLPQPTSITTSSGPISSASAIVLLVWVGWKTPSPSEIVKGPVRPFQSRLFEAASVMVNSSSLAGEQQSTAAQTRGTVGRALSSGTSSPRSTACACLSAASASMTVSTPRCPTG